MSGGSIQMSGVPYQPTEEDIKRVKADILKARELQAKGTPKLAEHTAARTKSTSLSAAIAAAKLKKA